MEHNKPAIETVNIKPITQGLYPTMESLQSVIDLAYSQLPITSNNQILGLLMCYHNTLLKQAQNMDVK